MLKNDKLGISFREGEGEEREEGGGRVYQDIIVKYVVVGLAYSLKQD